MEKRLFEILKDAKTIAVVGTSINTEKPSSKITKYLISKGYEVHPVNPVYVGKKLGGIDFIGSLTEIEKPVDIVDVFRKSESLQSQLPDILTIRPKVVWLQIGIRNEEFEKKLNEANINVVVDHCIYKVLEKMNGK